MAWFTLAEITRSFVITRGEESLFDFCYANAILLFAFRREYATIAVPLLHSTFADGLRLVLWRHFFP
jgi:hypothetical protein